MKRSLDARCLSAGRLLLAGVSALLLLEAAVLCYNARSGLARPFLADTGVLLARSEGRKLSYLDPLLGVAYNPHVMEGLGYRTSHGFDIHGDPGDLRALRIVTLGGSTTERFLGDWPKALYEECREAGIPVVVFNGGVSSYSSSQEFLKLVRDGIMLRPDVVVSYDGVNDRGQTHSFSRYGGLLHPIHRRIYPHVVSGGSPFLLPNIAVALSRTLFSKDSIEGIEWGIPRAGASADEWLRNIRAMRALSLEFGFHYAAFLQPAFGVGAHKPSAEERRRVEVPWEARRSLARFYADALRHVAGRDYIIDLTGVFAGRSGIYRDYCHVHEEGNGLVARAVFRELRSRGWLGRSTSSRKA